MSGAKTQYGPTPQEAGRSPCTPPLQSIERRKGNTAEKQHGSESDDMLGWSPKTPDTLPITSIQGAVMAAAQGASAAESPAAAADVALDDQKSDATVPAASVLSYGWKEASGEDEGERRETAPSPPCEALDAASTRQLHAEADPLGQPTAAALTSSPLATSASHVDPAGEAAGSLQRHSSASASTTDAAAAAAAEASEPLKQRSHRIFFPADATSTAVAALFVAIAGYCDLATLAQLMRVSRTAHHLATSDDVWQPILMAMNLSPLLSAYDRTRDLYEFFLADIITTRALHGHYTFQAANGANGSRSSLSNASNSRAAGANRDHLREEDSLQEDIFNIASLQLLISAASLGQSNHLIGRVQLLLTYKNESMEVLQGSCRFSVFRRCFSLCCSAFGTVKRGPVFTVAVATVTKPWANEGFQHFSEHKNGIRLVMTPVLWEGQSPGSQITEHDILVVSRPKPVVTQESLSSADPPQSARE